MTTSQPNRPLPSPADDAPIIKRRISLGSGLSARKLIDAIGQIAQSTSQSTSLACDAPGYESGWVHLTLQSAGSSTHILSSPPFWVMTFGYDLNENPLTFLSRFGLDMLPETDLIAWVPELYASVRLPQTAAIPQLATLLVGIMQQVQGVSPESVEVAIHYDQM